jgi:uncharacterized protein (TIGR02118 family)
LLDEAALVSANRSLYANEVFRCEPTTRRIHGHRNICIGLARSFPRHPSGEDTEMARLVVMYRTPQDVAAFDEYYFKTHVPIAKKIPGLRKYEVSQGGVGTPAGASDLHLIATLHFDDLAAIQHAFASPEGQAAAADVQVFANGGVDMLIYDTREI